MREQLAPGHMLAVSWSRANVGPGPAEVAAAVAMVGLDKSDVLPGGPEHERVYTGVEVSRSPSTPAVLCHLTRARRAEGGKQLTCEQERGMLAGETGIRPLGPYAVAGRLSDDQPFTLVVDAVGLRQTYWHQGNGWAAVSTSPRPLARLAGAGVDTAGLAAYSMLGFHLGRHTMFEGVHQVGPGGRVVLRAGRAEIHEGPVTYPVHEELLALPLVERVRRAAAVLTERMDEYLSGPDEVSMELSGGLDSRTLLAAIPESRRRGTAVLTVSDGSSRDAPIAATLVARYGLRQTVVDLRALHDVDEASTGWLVGEAARRFECAADPIGHAVLDWAEQQFPGGVRIHGVGGEVGRGFYYALQRDARHPSARRVSRLARWRMMPNESADPAMLVPELAAAVRTDALGQVQQAFASYDHGWLRATDEFYLRERMCRWAGAAFTTPALQRELIGPLFDPRFLDLAHSCPPEDKRASRFMCMVLQELDPELSSRPLHDGRIPDRVARGGVGTVARSVDRTARTFSAKASQRVRRIERPASGTALLAPRLVSWWQADPTRLDGARRTGLVDEAWLDTLLGTVGERTAPSGVASLGLCAVLNEVGNTISG